jgi:hypothetical protein
MAEVRATQEQLPLTRRSYMGEVGIEQNMFCAHGTTSICDDWQAPLADIHALSEQMS